MGLPSADLRFIDTFCIFIILSLPGLVVTLVDSGYPGGEGLRLGEFDFPPLRSSLRATFSIVTRGCLFGSAF